MNKKHLEKILRDAFMKAIEDVGMETFKKCSFFGSNEGNGG